MNSEVFREIEQQINYEAQQEQEELDESIDDDTPQGEEIEKNEEERILKTKEQRLNCLYTLNRGETINEELDDGYDDMVTFLQRNEFGSPDENGYFQLKNSD